MSLSIRWQAIFLVSIVILAVWLRTAGLEWGLPDGRHRNSFVPDENSWVYILGQMKPQRGDFNPHYFSNPTLHLYLAGVAMKIAHGLGYLDLPYRASDEEVRLPVSQYARLFLIGRYLSWAFSLLTVLLVYFIGKEIFGPVGGLVASLSLSVAPSHVIHSHFFSVNTAVTFWLAASFFFTIKLLESGRWRWYILAGIATGLAISTKYSAGPFALIPVMAHFMAKKDKSPLYADTRRRQLATYLALVVISFFLGSPYILLAKREFIEGVSIVSRLGFGSKVFSNFDIIRPARVLLGAMGAPLLATALIGAVPCLFNKRESGILILTWVGLFYLITSRMPYYITDSRMLPILPFLCLLGGGLSLKWKSSLRVLLITSIILGYNLPLVIALEKRFHGPDPQETASDWILENIPAGMKIGYETRPYWWAPYIHYSPLDRSVLERNPLIICEWDKGVLAREIPPYFVATDLTFHMVPRTGADWQGYQEFREYLRENYRPIRQFTKEFSLTDFFKVSIETKPDKGAFMDFYYQPIYILKRVEGGMGKGD